MLIKLSRRPIKSRFYAVDNEGNVICEGGDYLYVETKLRDILSDDEIEEREIEIINDEIESSRRPVESSFIVGKQDNGNKVYFCEDGLYYSENDYARPSIKIFDNKREADKIAKRSKSGFVIPLEK